MKYFHCDRCGKQVPEYVFELTNCAEVKFNGPPTIGELNELVLCSDCAFELRKWVAEHKKEDKA